MRSSYLYVCILFSIPVFIGFGIRDLYGNRVFAVIDFAGAAYLTLALVFFRKRVSERWLFKAIMLMAFVFLQFYLHYPAGNGTGMLWTYIFPLVSYQLLGKRQGLIWNIVFLAVTATCIYRPSLLSTWVYNPGEREEYLVSFSVVTAFSYVLESLKTDYSNALEVKNRELEAALDNVKVLKGLLPICSYCKKIRDDQGYWNQLESFIDANSDAKFSHSVCPDCIDKHFPGLD
jgi:hypothetical protein